MDPNGTLWLGLSKGLYKKAPDEAVSQIIPNKYINDIICVGDSLFTGTSNGVLYISCSNPQHTKVLTENKNVQTLFMIAHINSFGSEHSIMDYGHWIRQLA